MTPKQKRIAERNEKAAKDNLVDRNCAILDGSCDCLRLPGNTFPECKRYEASTN